MRQCINSGRLSPKAVQISRPAYAVYFWFMRNRNGVTKDKEEKEGMKTGSSDKKLIRSIKKIKDVRNEGR